MAQDLKKLLHNDHKSDTGKMPKGHEARFLQKLDKALPQKSEKHKFSFLNIAASIVIVLSLSFGVYQFLSNSKGGDDIPDKIANTKSIGDVSPKLKKVEDYYLASINLELSKLQIDPENKELFDGYLLRMEELTQEYKLLSDEFVTSPNEQTADALINNLKLRLNLMFRLKEKLSELKKSDNLL